MLKTFEFIKKFEHYLNELSAQKVIDDFALELKLNQEIIVHIVNDDIDNLEGLLLKVPSGQQPFVYQHSSLFYEFITTGQAQSELYDYLFDEEKVHYGLRRSLQNLITPAKCIDTAGYPPLVTFFSYKGGVGRTTSLALFASYYAKKGKNVFVLDCDFEAPGLVNFFTINQFENPKSGVIEYLLDSKFEPENTPLNEYVYEVSAKFSGEGQIHLMPAGNIFGDNRADFLEGLSRVDLHGPSVFLNDFSALINNINSQYKPDLILVDSRTGFNNVFGCLAQLSDTVVALAGDDLQNQAGIEFLLEHFAESEKQQELIMVLSIISTSVLRRFDKFKNRISEYSQDFNVKETEQSAQLLPEVKMFYFPRELSLEMVGTESEDVEDFEYFTASNAATSYHPFFQYLDQQLIANEGPALSVAANDGLNDDKPAGPQDVADTDNEAANELSNATINQDISQNTRQLADCILEKLERNFPKAYGEELKFKKTFFEQDFYIRQCMQDLFLPENKILLGGKGTGKTTFYRALQNENFFNVLINRSQKQQLKFEIINMIALSDDNSAGGFIDFSANIGKDLDDEMFVRRLWTTYIWVTLFKRRQWAVKPELDLFEIKDGPATVKAFKAIIHDDEQYVQISNDLDAIDQALKSAGRRLMITFDRLDEVVKPNDWNKGIAPLIRFFQNNPWQNIHPKLFLRRDLFNKLGNITNKNALERQTISLEWSHDEMYAFFFKVVCSHAKQEFFDYLKMSKNKLSASFIKNNIEKVLEKKNYYNQLPADSYQLKPLVNAFFGKGQYANNDAYEALYYNLKNADNTISLRPFLDLIKFAMEEQSKDDKFRKGSVLGLDYCFYKSVRAKAVARHFDDLADEEGNHIIRHFVRDIKDNDVSKTLKYSFLYEREFEQLVKEVKSNHLKELQHESVTTFEKMLEINGIMFVSTISGNQKKYSFAFLYKHYLDLKTRRGNRRKR